MSKTWVRVIAILEMVGGLFGVLSIVWQLVAATIVYRPLPLAFIVLAIYIFSFIAGFTLWREQPFGRIASIIIQAIQLPKYFSQFLIFTFSFGFDAYIYGALFNNLNLSLGIEFKFLAFHQLFINMEGAAVGFGVSIPASIFLAKLIKYKPRPLSQ